MRKFSFMMVLLLSVWFSRADAQKNLVTNGGFEDELFGWNGDGARLTPYDLKSGKKSCAIVTMNANNWVGIDQIVRIPKKAKELVFSAWLKAINVVKGKNDWDGAIFTVVFLDAQDKELGSGLNIARLTGDQEWKQFEAKIMVNEKAGSFKILLAMGNASGTMLIDDVAAKVLE